MYAGKVLLKSGKAEYMEFGLVKVSPRSSFQEKKNQRFTKSTGITSSPSGPVFKSRKSLEANLSSVFVLALLQRSATRIYQEKDSEMHCLMCLCFLLV